MKNAKKYFKVAIQEHNDAYGDDPKMKWNGTTIKDGFFYGEHKMAERMDSTIKDVNEFYMAGSGYRVVKDGDTKTGWAKKTNYGWASQKIKFVEA